MNRNQNQYTTALSVVLSVALAVSFALLPQTIKADLWYLAACAALPEGAAARLHPAVQAERKAEKTDQSSVPVEAPLPDAADETPADILQWMHEAQQAAASQKKDGDIRSETLGKKSATDTFRNLLIRNMTDDVKPDFEAQWDADANLKIDKTAPAVLIFHTHTTEGYELLDRDWYAADTTSRTTDTNRNVARVGSAIAGELEKAGFRVIHDKTVHDAHYTGAYDRSRETVEKYLKQYPNLSVVLDVHRDAIQENNGTKVKPVVSVGGKKAAQIMIISGCEGGKVTDFPNWEQNLRFALRLQDACERTAPGLMRPIFFCHRQYNMDMTPCSLLVEFGSDANTLEEAVYSGRLFGEALSALLEQYIV